MIWGYEKALVWGSKQRYTRYHRYSVWSNRYRFMFFYFHHKNLNLKLWMLNYTKSDDGMLYVAMTLHSTSERALYTKTCLFYVCFYGFKICFTHSIAQNIKAEKQWVLLAFFLRTKNQNMQSSEIIPYSKRKQKEHIMAQRNNIWQLLRHDNSGNSFIRHFPRIRTSSQQSKSKGMKSRADSNK